MKQFFKKIGCIILSLFLLLFTLILLNEFYKVYKYNHKFSIAMPTIIGKFENYKDLNRVEVVGIENIVNENIASLNINETYCSLDKKGKYCIEKRAVIMGFGGDVYIYPYFNEYVIKYSDKNKIIFGDYIGKTIGEIDLNLKTLNYVVKNAGYDRNKTRNIEIVTDNKKIEELEKKIIKSSLKREWFR